MKVCLPSVFLALTFAAPVVEGRIFSFLHSHNDEGEAGSQSGGDGVGFFVSDNEFKAGRRGLACLQYAAGVETDPFGDLGIMLGPMTRVLLRYFGEDGLNRVCASTYQGRKLLAEANGEDEPIEESTETQNYTTPIAASEERRTQSCTDIGAIYPDDPLADPEGVYMGYTHYYRGVFVDGNLGSRSNTPMVIEQLQDEISYLSGVQNDLQTCSGIWGAVNSIIGVADVPGVDIEELSEGIKGFSCDLVYDYNDIMIKRYKRNLERVVYHDQLIDSAETSAAFENTKAMLAEVCSVTTNLQTVRLEMEVIDASVTP